MSDPQSPRIQIGSEDVLLVIDVQRDFCANGHLAIPGGDAVVDPINQLGRHFEHVILTQDWHPIGHNSFASSHPGKQPYETIEVEYGQQTLWPGHCVQGTQGAEFQPGLITASAELVLRKGFRREIDSYSAFLENDKTTPTGLAGYLRERGLKRIFLAGLAYDFCVRFSALDGKHAGFETIVIQDACRAVNLPNSVSETQNQFKLAGVKEIRSAELLPTNA